MILGHGIDVVDTERIKRLMEAAEEDFLFGSFTRLERQLESRPSCRVEFFAGRLAAKEAVVKALGTGFSGDVSWQQVEIFRNEDDRPGVRLSGTALVEAERLGVRRWLLSISHSDTVAVASAIALGS